MLRKLTKTLKIFYSSSLAIALSGVSKGYLLNLYFSAPSADLPVSKLAVRFCILIQVFQGVD